MPLKLNLPGGSSVMYDKPVARINPRFDYGVTGYGKMKAEEGEIRGPRGRVLGAVNDVGPAKPSEIATEANLPIERVREILRYLMKRGYVQQGNEDDS